MDLAQVLHINIQEMQVIVSMLHSQLPVLPLNATINNLKSESAVTDQQLTSTINEIGSLLMEVALLNDTLQGLTMQYQGLLSQLNPIIAQINSYSSTLDKVYEDTSVASIVVADLTELAKMVLNTLENFSDNIRELQEKADDAMMSVSDIQASLNSTEDKVGNAMSDLSDVYDILNQALPLAAQLETDSQTLNEV